MNTTTTRIDTDTRVLFVGGGTGGHFYPLIALAEQFNSQLVRPELYYAGPEEYDAEALRAEGITFIQIGAGKRRRYASFLNILDLVKTLLGIFSAVIKLFVLYPDVVVSKGGYTSVPVVIAASFLRIPIIVHESDSVLGRANRFALRHARYFITTYATLSIPPTNAIVQTLGIPVRSVLQAPPSPQAEQVFGIEQGSPVILILGGSSGAERLNEFILDSLDELLPDFHIIHQTGKNLFDACVQSARLLISDPRLQEKYHPVPFLDGPTLNDAYHVASLVISRAGSSSIYEIALHGKPSILIPIPEEISHDQRSNAYAYARSGATVVMEEKNLSDNLLQAEIGRIMQDTAVYTAMVESTRSFARVDTRKAIVDLITQVSIQH